MRPESDADFVGKKRPKKADYAILKDNAPIMLIECKPYGSNLDNHTSQLQGYFAADDDAQIGIMTDGGLYRFYSDLEKPNKMDGVPFLEFNLFDIQESLGKELERFTKSKFNLDSIVNSARDLKYRKEIKDILKKRVRSTYGKFCSIFFCLLYTVVQKRKQWFSSSQRLSSVHSTNSSVNNNTRKANQMRNDLLNKIVPLNNQPTKKIVSRSPGKVLIFDGGRQTFDSYKECWIKCCEILFERHSERVEELLEKKFGKERRPKFSKKTYRFFCTLLASQ